MILWIDLDISLYLSFNYKSTLKYKYFVNLYKWLAKQIVDF